MYGVDIVWCTYTPAGYNRRHVLVLSNMMDQVEPCLQNGPHQWREKNAYR